MSSAALIRCNSSAELPRITLAQARMRLSVFAQVVGAESQCYEGGAT